MAVFTDICRLDMCRVLARRTETVVTADAGVRNTDVIEIRGDPGVCRVTVLAVVAAANVCRVLAGCRRAVVTGEAASQDVQVIDKVCRRPHDVVMAVFTDIGSGDVRRTFADSIDVVVTIDAISGDVHVIEVRRGPRSCCMTVITDVATRDMRRVLACRDDAVMTRCA